MKKLKNNWYMIRFVLRYAPGMFILKIINTLTSLAVNIGFNVFFLKNVVDSMEYGGDFQKILIFIAAIGALIIFDGILTSIFQERISPKGTLKIHKGMHNQIFDKIKHVELENFDDSDFYNSYILAINEADNCALRSFNVVTSLISNVLAALSFSSIAIFYDPMLLVFSIVPIIATTFLGIRQSHISVAKREESIYPERKSDYSKRVFYLQQYAKELRLYPSMNKKVVDEFNDSVQDRAHIIDKYSFKMTVINFLCSNFQVIFCVLCMSIYISWRVIVQGSLSAGVFVAMFTAVNNFTYSIGAIFNSIPQITENGLYAEKVRKILDYRSKMENPDAVPMEPEAFLASFREIELINVSFRYPGSDTFVLRNINLKIHDRERIALVGFNGAGKSTLVKLIMRLYDPTEGEIRINGVNIKEIDVETYRKLFQVVFQDFQLYAFSLGSNIMMRDPVPGDDRVIDDALDKSHLPEFKDLKEKNLTREFDKDGLIPSGGQSQKIAIARALAANNGRLVVMDEASSALDPVSEYNINKSIFDNTAGKSMIIISHRLSTVQYADKIYYLNEGEITESGTHEELIGQRGSYCAMYEKQAESYRL